MTKRHLLGHSNLTQFNLGLWEHISMVDPLSMIDPVGSEFDHEMARWEKKREEILEEHNAKIVLIKKKDSAHMCSDVEFKTSQDKMMFILKWL